jgi:hypothetical protein
MADDLFPGMKDFMTRHGYICIAKDYNPELFGNAYAIWSGKEFDLYFVKDRGVTSVLIGPSGYGAKFISDKKTLLQNKCRDVLQWQSLGNRWYLANHVLEFLGVPFSNAQESMLTVLGDIVGNCSEISGTINSFPRERDLNEYIAKKPGTSKMEKGEL